LFAGWLAANYLDGALPGRDAPYRFHGIELAPLRLARTIEGIPAQVEGSVVPYGADYILLPATSLLSVEFSGVTRTLLLPTAPHGGRNCWWSNRADQALTALTWELDLSPVPTATLRYWAWYDLEEGFDYVTLEARREDSPEWELLRPGSATDANPHGNNPGWGYTGRSSASPDWIAEQVDLTPFCGGRVQIRFTYLTDEAVTGEGFLLDDVRVPEIGFAAGAEAGETLAPTLDGFLRTDGWVPQRYLALLIGTGETASVEPLAVDRSGRGSWAIDAQARGWSGAVLVLAGLAPLTTHAAPYRLTIRAAENDTP